MARSHGAKRHFNDFPGSSQGDESDGYLSVTLQFPRSRYSHDQRAVSNVASCKRV